MPSTLSRWIAISHVVLVQNTLIVDVLPLCLIASETISNITKNVTNILPVDLQSILWIHFNINRNEFSSNSRYRIIRHFDIRMFTHGFIKIEELFNHGFKIKCRNQNISLNISNHIHESSWHSYLRYARALSSSVLTQNSWIRVPYDQLLLLSLLIFI